MERAKICYKRKQKKHNANWPKTPFRILITGYSGSGITNALITLINHEPDVDKIHIYAKDPYQGKYQFLIKKREVVEAII